MNLKQKNILLIGLIFLAGAISYAPWVSTYQNKGISQIINPAGYHFLFNPPSSKDFDLANGIVVDYNLYIIQILFVLVTFGVLYFVFDNRKKD